MSETVMISELIHKINDGQIRIPSFQRGFIWDADRVAHLMDSIYKGFPFGTLLLWRTKTPLRVERKLGPYKLPEMRPDYPIDYVLDGQQRATSIFGVFQHLLSPEKGDDDAIFKIFYDLTPSNSIQDSNFIFVSEDEIDRTKHFPLNLLFNPPEYRKYLKDLPEDIATKVDKVFEKFNSTKIPIQIFETNDRAAVAIVFERINRLGVELDTLQLLSAWTWSEDFDLQDEFAALAEELESFGFKDVGEDSDLLLRCCSAVINNDASPAAIIEMKGEEVRNRFQEITNGIQGAIDYLRHNCNVTSASSLPFINILIPLTVLFSSPDEQGVILTHEQNKQVRSWIWKTFFSMRYSKRLEQMNDDIRYIKKLKEGKESRLGDFVFAIKKDYFKDTLFNLNSVKTKTFILLLANQKPLNFISGSSVGLERVLQKGNKKEFHHIFPKKYLLQKGVNNTLINSLVNYAVIGRSENNNLGGVAPSIYKNKMPQNSESIRMIMESSFCSNTMFNDDFDAFISHRNSALIAKAEKLMEVG